MRTSRFKAHLRVIETIWNISNLPAYFYAPQVKAERFDGRRKQLSEEGWFAVKPQDKRLTEDEKLVLAKIEKRLFA